MLLPIGVQTLNKPVNVFLDTYTLQNHLDKEQIPPDNRHTITSLFGNCNFHHEPQINEYDSFLY